MNSPGKKQVSPALALGLISLALSETVERTDGVAVLSGRLYRFLDPYREGIYRCVRARRKIPISRIKNRHFRCSTFPAGQYPHEPLVAQCRRCNEAERLHNPHPSDCQLQASVGVPDRCDGGRGPCRRFSALVELPFEPIARVRKQEVDEPVTRQVFRHSWPSHTTQIVRRCDVDPPGPAQWTKDKVLIFKSADTYSKVDTVANEVAAPIAHDKFDVYLGMLLDPLRQTRNEYGAGNRAVCADPHAAFQRVSRFRERRFDLVEFSQHPSASFEIAASRWRRGNGPGRAREKLDAERLFELRYSLRCVR